MEFIQPIAMLRGTPRLHNHPTCVRLYNPTPYHLYTMESFDSWLQFFLASKVIEDSLHEAFNHHRNHIPAAFCATMNDIQDSPAWDDLQDFLQSPYHLMFRIYIDWFNPYTNKIAGKLLTNSA